MAEAGADVLVPHMGLTTKGSIGALRPGRSTRACHASRRCTTRRRPNPEILVLCHGGPIAEPEDAAYVLERTSGVVGFFGASSMERLPTEVAMTENMKRFKAIPCIQRKGQRMSRFVLKGDLDHEESDWGAGRLALRAEADSSVPARSPCST